jgi:hypothetical protein
MPQSEALATAREAIQSAAAQCGEEHVHIEGISRAGIRGYQASYGSWWDIPDIWHDFGVQRRLYVIPITGTAESGQQIDGFLFEIIYPTMNMVKGVWGGCKKTLDSTLQTALDATGKATAVTSTRLRPYGKGRAAL